MKKIYFIPFFLLILGIIFFVIYHYVGSDVSRDGSEINTASIPKPSREPYENCKWERVIGKDIEVWGQRCDWGKEKSWVRISETLPGIVEEIQLETGKVITYRYVQIFKLKNQKIEDVIPFLRKNRDWKETDLCQFQKSKGFSRPGVTAYILMPTGTALEKFKKEGKKYPINTTCAGFGSGNSGALWFEIHSTNPKRALFFSISFDLPLYDEKSIRVK